MSAESLEGGRRVRRSERSLDWFFLVRDRHVSPAGGSSHARERARSGVTGSCVRWCVVAGEAPTRERLAMISHNRTNAF